MKKPEKYNDSIHNALNEIRALNKVNMFLAGSFLTTEYYVNEKEADECVLYWIHLRGLKKNEKNCN